MAKNLYQKGYNPYGNYSESDILRAAMISGGLSGLSANANGSSLPDVLGSIGNAASGVYGAERNKYNQYQQSEVQRLQMEQALLEQARQASETQGQQELQALYPDLAPYMRGGKLGLDVWREKNDNAYRQQQLGLQRQQINNQAAHYRTTEEQARASLAQRLIPTMDNIQSVRTRYMIEAAPFDKLGSSLGDIASIGDSTDPASDTKLIFSYMKMLDPNSQVTEGERASASAAPGVPNWLLQQYNATVNGQLLTKQQRDDIFASALSTYVNRREKHLGTNDNYLRYVQEYNIQPDLIIRDLTTVPDKYAEEIRNRLGTRNASTLGQRFDTLPPGAIPDRED